MLSDRAYRLPKAALVAAIAIVSAGAPVRVTAATTCVAASLVSVAAVAAVSPDAARPASMATLQRTAAAIDNSLEVYRLALVDIVPAAQRIAATGQEADAEPTHALPEPVRATFRRLADSVQRRIDADSLTALPRAYHMEVVDALDRLAAATTLREAPPALQALHGALRHQAELAADIVDLFSRQRPIIAEVVAPDTALDAINEALGQLGLAEANIDTVRQRHGAPGEQLQAFLRLEIALGHALDLIATAEESGIHLGFEMPRATAEIASRLQQVQARLQQLAGVLQTMVRLPPAPGPVAVSLRVGDRPLPGTTGLGAPQWQLSWLPPMPGPAAPAGLRVYGMPAEAADVPPGPATGAATPSSAAAGAAAPDTPVPTFAHLPTATAGAPAPLADLPPGRASLTLSAGASPKPMQYRLASVSAFGIEHAGPWTHVAPRPATLVAPTDVDAQLAPTSPQSELFYYDADAVTVRWQRSASDADVGLGPRVAEYRIYRSLSGGAGPVLVGRVPWGVTTFVDRPSLADLATGVTYVVAAAAAGAGAPMMAPASPQVQADVSAALTYAAAGAAALPEPTPFAVRTAQHLRVPATLAAAKVAFALQPMADQRRALLAYWRSIPPPQRLRWHADWLHAMGLGQLQRFWQHAPTTFTARDRGWVAAALWVQENPDYAGEPARYFDLLGPTAQQAASRAFVEGLGVMAQHDRDADRAAGHGAVWDEPVQLQAWFAGRDPQEQTLLLHRWETLAPAARDAWFATLPVPLRQALAWPPWDSLTPAERAAFLEAPVPTDAAAVFLPDGLWPGFLAWAAWHDLSLVERTAWVAQDVGWATQVSSRLRYALRPLDKYMEFKLTAYTLLLAVGFAAGVVLRVVVKVGRRNAM